MKLNFWQWIGLGLLVLGLAWMGYNKWGKKSPKTTPPAKPATTTTVPVLK